MLSYSLLTYFSEGQLVVASICDRKVFGRVKVSGKSYYVSPLMLVGGVNVREIVDNHLLPGRQLLERLLVLEELLLGQREDLVAVEQHTVPGVAFL